MSNKFPNSIGIVSGADYDIDLRIRKFIAKELNLPMPRVTKVREPKTEEDKLKQRPKKNVTRLFHDAGASVKNLVMVRKVNLLNDTSGQTIGMTVNNIGKILFNIKVIYKAKIRK